MIIAVDFDGTCVTHEFPKVGRDIGAAPVLSYLVERGHQLILFTMRSDVRKPHSFDPQIVQECGDYLSDALKWFEKNNIELYGVQTNPEQRTWTESPKAYANLYIDDAALGCPLVFPDDGGRPFVDWDKVMKLLIAMGI